MLDIPSVLTENNINILCGKRVGVYASLPFVFNVIDDSISKQVMAKEYCVLSPDGFHISQQVSYTGIEKAKEARDAFVENYRKQGYYRSNKGIIDIKDLKIHCYVIPIDIVEETMRRIHSK